MSIASMSLKHRQSMLAKGTRELIDAQSKQAVAEQAVETARSVLDQSINVLWLHDSTDNVLQPVAMTAEAVEVVGAPPTYTGGESLSWEAFANNELRVYDDVRADSERFNAETPIRSEIILPLGEYGVLNIGATEPVTFSETDISLARNFGRTVEAALERADREQRLRNQRASLQRRNDRLDKFTGVVSHDLQNPLRVAAGKIKLAQEECESPHLDEAADALDRMETLIGDLLTIAREGTQVEETEATTLGAIAEESWSCVGTADATLRTETEQSIQADPSRLKQLLENLVRNAVAHGGEDVTVTVGELEDGFYVADNGPGILAEERDEVFEAGYSTTAEGTGFGLNIVQEIVEAHGWEISITDSDDGGARLEITDAEIVE
jgi:signal transduction histidine kinase